MRTKNKARLAFALLEKGKTVRRATVRIVPKITAMLLILATAPLITSAQISQKSKENWKKLRAYHEVKLSTVFDSVLLAKQHLTCNQYYNKLYSDYYKAGNYMGDKGLRQMGLGIRYSKETPCVLINGKDLFTYEFSDLTKFQKIKSLTFEKPCPQCVGAIDEFGIYKFEAE